MIGRWSRCVLIILIFLIGCNVAYKSYKNYKVFLVHARSEKDSYFLKNLQSNFGQIDFWDTVLLVSNISFRVMVHPDVIDRFDKVLSDNFIEHAVIIDDVDTVLQGEQFHGRSGSKFDFFHFWPYQEVNEYLAYLAKNYPTETKVSSIGLTWEEREIRSIYIKGVRKKCKKKIVIVDSAIHAREWVAPMVTLYLIYELVENRKKNLDLLLDTDWWIVPVVNPDGYVYSHEHDRLWRKTCSKYSNSTCFGVDPNRNFDFHWDTPEGSSTDPCEEDYRGPKASSEKIVQHISNILKKYKKTKIYLSFHSYAGCIMIPYSYKEGAVVNNYQDHERLAKLIRDRIFKRNGYEYKIGTVFKLMGLASGGSDSYAAGVAKIPIVLTMELPGGSTEGMEGFEMSTSQMNSVVKDTFEGLKAIGEFLHPKFKI